VHFSSREHSLDPRFYHHCIANGRLQECHGCEAPSSGGVARPYLVKTASLFLRKFPPLLYSAGNLSDSRFVSGTKSDCGSSPKLKSSLPFPDNTTTHGPELFVMCQTAYSQRVKPQSLAEVQLIHRLGTSSVSEPWCCLPNTSLRRHALNSVRKTNANPPKPKPEPKPPNPRPAQPRPLPGT